MSPAEPRGPIVIDTDVFSADLVPGSALAERSGPVITGRPAFISFQTVAELHYGALRRGWGTTRMLRLEAKVRRAEVVHSGPELSSSALSSELIATGSVTHLPVASTTLTDGLPRQRSVSGSHSSQTTRSSATYRGLALESVAPG